MVIYMNKLRIYLDTSVVNFLYADDAPDFKRVTVDFFEKHASKYELFASQIVLLEISRTRDEERKKLLAKRLRGMPVVILPFEPRGEIERMAAIYRQRAIIPMSKYEDALHVAHATIHEMDILLSWNFKHLANIRRETGIAEINMQEGYLHPLRLLSPLEVEDEDESE